MAASEYRVTVAGISYMAPAYFDEGNFAVEEGAEGAREVLVRRRAMRGEVVELSASEAKRLQGLGAIGPVDEPQAEPDAAEGEGGEEPPATINPSDMGDDELVAWITEARPVVSVVVDAAGNDPEEAMRLQIAEEAATGGEPRKGVIEGLQAIIDAKS